MRRPVAWWTALAIAGATPDTGSSPMPLTPRTLMFSSRSSMKATSIGGTSALFLHPETRTVVALMCNHSSSPFTKARWEALAEMFAPVYGTR